MKFSDLYMLTANIECSFLQNISIKKADVEGLALLSKNKSRSMSIMECIMPPKFAIFRVFSL